MTRFFRSLIVALVVISLSTPVALAGPASRDETREATRVGSLFGSFWDALASRWESRTEPVRSCTHCAPKKRSGTNSTNSNGNSNNTSNNGGNGNEHGGGMDPNG